MTNEAVRTPPYAAYAALMATFLSGAAGTSFVAGKLGREPSERNALDFLILGLATFKAARTLANDEVASFIREPFVAGAPADPEDEQPLQTGTLRQAIGELVTCSRCIGTWVGAGVAAVDIVAPRFSRTLILSLALGGADDWLQAGFSTLAAASNRLESR